MTTETGPASGGRPLDIQRTSSAGRDAEGERETERRTTSSRSDAQTASLMASASSLAEVVCSIRPDWSYASAVRAIGSDNRPWRTVVLASIRGAALTGADTIRHPNGLRYVNPDGTGATPTPMAYADWARAERCDNGAIVQPDGRCCPLCRMGVTL